MNYIIRTIDEREPLLTLIPEPWMQEASCAQTDPELFWPEGKGRDADKARKVCAGCPVVNHCAEYAVRTRQREGIWGNLSRRELRRRIREAEETTA